MPSRTSRVIKSPERRGGGSSPTAPIVTLAALALLGIFLASGDALGQSAPQDLSLGGAPDKDSAISISAQVSLVWQTDAHIFAGVGSGYGHEGHIRMLLNDGRCIRHYSIATTHATASYRRRISTFWTSRFASAFFLGDSGLGSGKSSCKKALCCCFW